MNTELITNISLIVFCLFCLYGIVFLFSVNKSIQHTKKHICSLNTLLEENLKKTNHILEDAHLLLLDVQDKSNQLHGVFKLLSFIGGKEHPILEVINKVKSSTLVIKSIFELIKNIKK